MEREVSLQRLVHLRDNWYLDAWCHLRNDVRSFSIDAIQRVSILDSAANKVSASPWARAMSSMAAVPKGGPNYDSRQRGRGGSQMSAGT